MQNVVFSLDKSPRLLPENEIDEDEFGPPALENALARPFESLIAYGKEEALSNDPCSTHPTAMAEVGAAQVSCILIPNSIRILVV